MQVIAVRVNGENLLALPEMAFTENVSPHGARIVTRKALGIHQDFEISSIAGNLKALARVVYCLSLPDQMFAIGLELTNPSGQWLIHSLRELEDYAAQL